jgi:hypothetical protein
MRRTWLAVLAVALAACGSVAPPTSAVQSPTGSPAPSASAASTSGVSPSPPPIVVASPLYATPLPANPPAQGRWETLAPLPTPRAYSTLTTLRDGRILIVGGQVANGAYGGQATSEVQIFDPATGKFSVTASLGIARAGHTATLLPDGKVLVVGGYPEQMGTSLNTAEIFDPASATWHAAASMSHARTGHAAVLLQTGKVLVVGGGPGRIGISPGGAVPAQLAPEMYDPATDSWTTAAMPSLDRPVRPTATLLHDGRVLVVGGMYMWQSPDANIERSEIYDPVTNTWSAVPADARSGARQDQSATLLSDGRVLIAGGMRELVPIAAASLYDPASNSWIELPNMTEARCGQGAVMLSTGNVLLAGSGCGWSEQSAGVEEYDPASYRWFAVAPLAEPVGFTQVLEVGAGRVLEVGGTSPAGAPTGDVELFSAT